MRFHVVTIYRKAARYWWSSLPALFLFAALIVGLERVFQSDESKGNSLTTYGAVVVLVWFFHRHFLFHEAPLSFRRRSGLWVKRPLGRFFLVSLALVFLPVGAALAIVFGFVPDADIPRQLIGAVLLIGLPLYFAAFSLFATALPASIDRDPRYSIAKGMRQAPRMAGLILAGPVASSIGIVALLILVNEVITAYAASPALDLAMEIVAQTLGFFNSILAAATFCHVYRRIVPEPEQPAPTQA